MSRLRGAAIAGAVAFSLAHVGSPDTIFEGQAGPYPVRVVVRTPGVVPGLADIAVRITGGPGGVPRVMVVPLRGGPPTAMDPPPDTARLVPGRSNIYSAQLWLMRPGAWSVKVTVAGDAGSGSVIVPVNALATRRLDMQRPIAITLVALGLFLFAGAVTIVYAAVREGVLPPGELPDARRRRRAWIVAGAVIPVFAAYLYWGNLWWGSEDAAFQRRMYRAPEVTSTVLERGSGRVFRLALDSARFGREFAPLIPDHGKLVHLFLIGAEEQAAVAHLHPLPVDSTTFEATLPPLPAGTYHVFADIVHETGFSQTLTDTVALAPPARAGWAPSDADDAWLAGAAAPEIEWARPAALRTGEDVELRFVVAGRPLEPYMGMAGHAIVARDDGGVFVHLHPNGTIPSAAQLVYQLRQPGDTVRGRLGQRITALSRESHDSHAVPAQTVGFPYAFPQPGRYRVWVQVKSGGRILTGVFAAEVT